PRPWLPRTRAPARRPPPHGAAVARPTRWRRGVRANAASAATGRWRRPSCQHLAQAPQGFVRSAELVWRLAQEVTDGPVAGNGLVRQGIAARLVITGTQ